MDLDGVDIDSLTEDELLEFYNNFLNMDENELISASCYCTGYHKAFCGYRGTVNPTPVYRTDYSCK